MTGTQRSAVTPGRSAGEVGFPLLGQLLVAISLVASVLAAWAIGRSWEAYGPRAPMLAAWVVTIAAVPVAVRRITAAGGGRPGTLAVHAAAVLAVDVVVPFTLDPALRTTPAAWNWRTGAVLIMVFSAYRPARDVMLLAGAHAGLGTAYGLAAGVSSTAIVVLMIVCMAPSFIASTYLAVYTESLRSRRTAVDLHTRTSALRAAERAQRQSVLDEVASIRHRIIALLESVGTGDRSPAGPDVRTEARDLSAALRRELDETRSRGWLLAVPSVAPGPTVDVLGPASLLDDDARASVAALVELLHRHPGFRNIVVTIGADRSPEATSGPGVDVTVVASGPASGAASGDPAILAAAEGLGTAVWRDAEADHLVVEASLARSARSQVSAVAGARPVPD